MKSPGRKPKRSTDVTVVQPKKQPTRREVTRAFKRAIAKLGIDPLEQLLCRDMPLLPPEERAKVWLALIPYLYSKLNSISVIPEQQPNNNTNVILANRPTLDLPPGTQGPSIEDLLRIASRPEPVEVAVKSEDDDESL
jgi:hypothetical protein